MSGEGGFHEALRRQRAEAEADARSRKTAMLASAIYKSIPRNAVPLPFEYDPFVEPAPKPEPEPPAKKVVKALEEWAYCEHCKQHGPRRFTEQRVQADVTAHGAVDCSPAGGPGFLPGMPFKREDDDGHTS